MSAVQSTGAVAPPGVTRENEQVGVLAGVVVSVSPRRRVRSQADVVRLIVGLALVGVGVLVATWLRNTIGGAEEDLVDVYERVPDRFAEVFTGLVVLGVVLIPAVALVVLAVRRRFRQAAALLTGAVGAVLAMGWLTDFLAAQGVIAAVDPTTDRVVELTDPAFATSPLIAAAVALVIIAAPWVSQQWRRVFWSGVVILVVFRVVSSTEAPLDIVVAIAVGMAVGSLALLAFGTEGSDPEAPELVSMLRSVGHASRIEQLPGNSPLVYRVDVAGAGPLEMRLRTAHDRNEVLLEQLWRSARLRRWVTDRPYDTVQRRIEHEALAQRAAADAGARVATVKAIVASNNGSVGLLETATDGVPASELAPGQLDRAMLIDVWHQVAALHADRIAHRNLGLGQVTVTPDGGAVLRGFDGAAIAASDRDLALDRAQLLVSTALEVGAPTAVDVALEAVGQQAVLTAVPYLQPLALPAPTRRAWRSNKEVLDALREAVRRATGVEPEPLARLDRIRPRTVVSLAAFAAAFYFLLPQLAHFDESAEAASHANWWWLGPMLVGAAATIGFAALAFVAAVPEPIAYLPALRMQLASSFVSRIAPANTGTLAMGVRFLQRSGLDPGPAAAAVGLCAGSGFVVHLVLTFAFLAWVGTSEVGFSLPQANVLFIVIAVAVSAAGVVVVAVPALRRRILPPLLVQIRNAASSVADVLTSPLRVISLVYGQVGVTTSFILTLAAAVAAFGGGVSFPEIGAAYLVASALGSAAPTPGGLGAVEFALIGALTGYGMSSANATSAVLTFRLITFWLPMLPGWFTFQWMQRREEI
jgi:glycosyltransferase 2 family protein